MLKEELKMVIESQRKELLRDQEFSQRSSLSDLTVLPGFATVISGVRRCGKSTLLRMLYQQNVDRYTYLHFDDPRLLEFSTDDFFRLQELTPETLFMFDEIQHVEGWESYIRYLTEKSESVYITGSNAAMLSGEFASLLTGRHLSHELFPYSYLEFINVEGLTKNAASLSQFLALGGFPEYVKHKNILILQSLFLDILERDIIARYQIRSSFEFKQLAIFLLNNIARPYSLRRLADLIKVGSPNTISTFVGYLENAYLFYSIPRFDYSIKKQLVNPKKIYCVDNGLVLANTNKMQEDLGRLIENAAFIHLRRQSRNISYFAGKGECDFIVQFPDQSIKCYQVCHTLTKENHDREINGLLEAMKFFDLDRGTVVTHDQSDQFEIDHKFIEVVRGVDFFSIMSLAGGGNNSPNL